MSWALVYGGLIMKSYLCFSIFFNFIIKVIQPVFYVFFKKAMHNLFWLNGKMRVYVGIKNEKLCCALAFFSPSFVILEFAENVEESWKTTILSILSSSCLRDYNNSCFHHIFMLDFLQEHSQHLCPFVAFSCFNYRFYAWQIVVCQLVTNACGLSIGLCEETRHSLLWNAVFL